MSGPDAEARQLALRQHQQQLRQCRACPEMRGPPVIGEPALSPVMLIGQAPGPRELDLLRPFAWTAGKTLFGWFGQLGMDEAAFRRQVYMAAVCRCFPGKQAKGGDRVPNRQEVSHCARWREQELQLLRPQLILPVGKLAIGQFLSCQKLSEVIGQVFDWQGPGFSAQLIPLPHPSGVSTWYRTAPGKQLLQQALGHIGQHPAWGRLQSA